MTIFDNADEFSSFTITAGQMFHVDSGALHYIENIGDEGDLQEVYDTERHLLYVACTRARDYLLLTSLAPASEFLADLQTK